MTERKEDPMKILLKSCNNFIKMSKDEKSEGIKINYWMGLENQIKTLKIDNDTSINIIFEEILKKQTSILKSKHLLYSIINCLKKKNEALFIMSFFEILMIFSQEYDENQQYFNDYLIDLSLKMFFELYKNMTTGNDKNEEKGKLWFHFFNFLIEKDLNAFGIRFNFFYLNENFREQLLHYATYVKLFTMYIAKIGMMLQWDNMQYLLGMIKPEVKIIDSPNKKFFYNELIKILNDAMIRNISKVTSRDMILQLVFFTIQLTKNVINDIEEYDQFLLNALEMIISIKTFHFELIKIMYDLYHLPEANVKIFKKMLPCVLYYMCDSCYASDHIDFYLQCILTLSPLYQRIMIKKINVMQMISPEFNQSIEIMLIINDNISNDQHDTDFSFPIDVTIKSLKHLSNLTLIDYLLNNCISSSSTTITFNQTKFIRILQCYLNLSIKATNPLLFKSISEFLIFFLSSMIDLCLLSKTPLNSTLIDHIFSIIKFNDIDYQTEAIYPIIIQIMRGALIPNYQLFSINQHNDTLELFFKYLMTFARNDNIALLTSRLLVILFNSKSLQGNEHKIFSYEMLVELCLIANNSKIFLFFFDFAKEMINKPDTKYISLCAINDYSIKYEGALQSSLQDYVMNSFQQIYDKATDLIQFDSDMLFATSTMVKIFQKDKQEPLMVLLKQYFTRNTFFEVIEKLCLVIKENEPSCSLNELGLSYNDDNNKEKNIIEKSKTIQENIKALDYQNYIIKKSSKCNSCYYAILKQLSILFSNLLAYYITEENEANHQSDQKQTTPMYNTIVKYFDFIWANIVNISNKDTCHIIIINEILFNEINYNFFYITHSNLIANKQIKETNSDYSHLEELTIEAINHKHNTLIASIKCNRERIFLLADAFKTIISKEIKMIILSNKQSSKRVMLYNSIWSNSLFNNATTTTTTDTKQIIAYESSFFILEFNALLFTLNDIEINQLLYAFFLENKIFAKYFKQLSHLVNFDIVLLEYYSIIREKDCAMNLIKNFIDFIKVYLPISKQVQQFILRLLSNYDIFIALFNKLEQGQNNDQQDFYNVIFELFETFIKYNSYQSETKETLICIINNMQRNMKENCVYPRDSLEFYANFLLKLYTVFKENSNNSKGDDLSLYQINPKLKSVLQDQLLTSFLPILIEEFHKEISSEFNTIKKHSHDIDYLYKTLDYIIQFKTSKIINELNKNISDQCIITWIDRFSQCDSAIITNVQLNNISNDYANDIINKNTMLSQFTKYFFLYRSINLPQENKLKILKDQTLILLEQSDDNKNEYKKRLGYALLLCALYSSNSSINENNKSNYLFNDQFDIYEEIGEIMSNDINNILN